MIEDKQVRHLIAVGKERGYLLYKEVNDSLSAEVHSSEEIDDLLSTFERYGIDVYEDLSTAKAALAATGSSEPVETKEEPGADDGELDLTPGTLEKTNDPVGTYIREMGTVPLLTREGEVAIAKRIERGQLLVLKTITRAPLILKELLAGRRRSAHRVAFDQGNRPIRRRRAHRRKDRSENERDVEADRQGRQALPCGDEASAKTRKSSALEEASLSCAPVMRWGARASRCPAAFANSTSIRSKRSV